MADEPVSLRRVLRLPHATALVAGTIIGASIFVQPSEVTTRVPHFGGTVLVWLAAGALTLVGALVCAELSSWAPQSGGVYVYLTRLYSPALGFLWGWAMFWTMHSGIIAAIATVCARYLGYFVPLGGAGTRLTAVAAILLLSWVNHRGVAWGAGVQSALTALKLLAILLIVAVGFAVTVPQTSASVTAGAMAPGGTWGARDFLLALVAALFAFGGWHMVTYSAEETVAPQRTLPRALVLGVAIVTAAYVGMNAVYFRILPLAAVVRSPRVAADAADAVLGFGGGAVMAALVVVSSFGALAGIVLAGPRVYYAMGRDGLLPSWIATVHPRHRTPSRAIWLQAVWSAVLALSGSYRALFTRVTYTEWIFFSLLAVGILRLRAGGERGAYAMPFVPALPVLFAASAAAVVGNQLLHDPIESAIGLSFVLAGLPVYAWRRRRGATGGAGP